MDNRQHSEKTREYSENLHQSTLMFSLLNTDSGPKLKYKCRSNKNEHMKTMNIKRVINVSKDFTNGTVISKLALIYTGDLRIVISYLQEKLPVLVEICEQSFEVWETTKKILKTEDIGELKKLASVVEIMIKNRRRKVYHEKVSNAAKKNIEDNESQKRKAYHEKVRRAAEEFVKGSESQKSIAKTKKMSRSYFNTNIKECLNLEEYIAYKEKMFKPMVDEIIRIIKIARRIKEKKPGDNAKIIAADPSINISTPTLYKDIDKRFTELLNIYKYNEYIRKILVAECGISSYDELKDLYYEAHKILDKMQPLGVKDRKDKQIADIADYIINEYNKSDKDNRNYINAQEAADYFRTKRKIRITSDTVTLYMKGRLFRVDDSKYRQVEDIWKEDPRISTVNRFDNDIPVTDANLP